MNIKKIIIISILLSLFVNILNAEIILSFVGDVMTGSDYPNKSYLPSNEGKDIFKSVENYFKNSDINFANLEGAIANTNTQSSKRSKNSYSFFCYKKILKSWLLNLYMLKYLKLFA